MSSFTETPASSESSFFVEYNEVITLIDLLPIIIVNQSNDNNNCSLRNDESSHENRPSNENDSSNSNGNQALSKLKQIFDKYLECPTLLDSKLEHLLSLLNKHCIQIIHELCILLEQSQNGKHDVNDDDDANENKSKEEDNSEYILKIIILKRYLSAIYTVCKVRGYKHIAKYLSHEAKDVEPVLGILRHLQQMQNQQQNQEHELQILLLEHYGIHEMEIAQHWESIYVLLLWLGMLSLVPFDLNTIDSSASSSSSSSTTAATKNTLISSMITTIQQHLNDAGPTRIIASSSLAKLFSRPDLEQNELHSFVLFSNDVLKSFLTPSTTTMTTLSLLDNNTSIFLVMGIFQTLANVFKSGNRSNLMKQHLSSIEILWENSILLSEQCSASHNSSSTTSVSSSSSTSLVLRKFLVKLFARVGCSYLPPRIAKWRYRRGKRSLLENLSSTISTPNNTDTHSDCQNNSNNDYKNNNDDADMDSEDELFDVPDQVEDSMAQLIQSLTDPATTVRWSAAKGIGRLTERLPILCANDVLDALLDLCKNDQNYENDNIWHGSCLTLAELARRGLLLPERLNEVIPIVIQAIQYDVPRGSHSVGSHVRDASCYVCWAFARAYAPSILQPYVQDLSKAIVIASLFDREINCRRAASAAFQECVGRQGADNFKHGIAILTSADYFTLGNRVEAYTTVARKIALFEEYRHPLIDHLRDEKLFHWDIDIRNLSAAALGMLTPLEPDFFVNVVLPDLLPLCTNETLFVRHGAVLGVSEIILALGSKADDNEDESIHIHDHKVGTDLLSDELKETISGIVFQIEKARLYRGRGGEIMRSAVSRYIECISKSKIPLSVKKQVALLDSLDANLKHPNEDIQKGAADALAALMTSYFPVGVDGPSERLQNRVVNKYMKSVREEENPAATRGYSLALGSLPAKLIAHNSEVLNEVIDCLTYASNSQTKVSQQGDAETRRNAIESLVRVCKTVGIGEVDKRNDENYYPVVGMNKEQVQKVFDCLLTSINDYNTDRRGDIGSWSRIAAIQGLTIVSILAVKASNIPHNSLISSGKRCVSVNGIESLPMIPSFNERIDTSFESDVLNKVEKCLTDNEPYREYNERSMLSEVYFDDQLCATVLGAILKQLAEKLDAVRNHAGNCLEQLTLGPDELPFIPCKEMLVEAVEFGNHFESSHDNNESKLNWGSPELTFPILMRVVNIDAFFRYIISGLVISVGGLTESITKHSTKSFLDYLRALQKTKRIGRISKIGKGEECDVLLFLKVMERYVNLQMYFIFAP